jgi:hypothetical protein
VFNALAGLRDGVITRGNGNPGVQGKYSIIHRSLILDHKMSFLKKVFYSTDMSRGTTIHLDTVSPGIIKDMGSVVTTRK